MSVILTIIGLLLLAVSLVAIAFGIYMATELGTREAGKLFAILWIPGVAAASGVLMRDVVTFAVGLLCLLVAGAVFVFEDTTPRKPLVRNGLSGRPGRRGSLDSERTTKENRARGYGKAAS